jgi:monofunctional chorismate mutase
MTNLEQYRKQIDQIDEKILDLLEKRLQVAEQIASHKRVNKINIVNPDREKQILDQWQSNRQKLSRTFISKIVSLILAESKKYQAKLTKN